MKIKNGMKIKDFPLVSTDEKKSKLKDYLGKNLILYFYPKDLTPGCTSESIEFNENLTKIRRLGWDVVGISRDSIKSHHKFIEKHNFKFSLISDENEKICKLFDVIKEKSLYGRKYMGVDRSTFLISKKFEIKGSKNLFNLPESNVLFVSNHQTYFYDVIAMLHVFNSSVKGRIDSVKRPKYLISPKTNLYYIASLETMKKSLVTKLLTYAGAVLVQRSWRESGEDVNREIRAEDPNKIRLALEDGWVITFPRGTTDNSKPVRKGTAHIIKDNNPTVIPVKISGFNEVFQRNGLKVINRKLPFSIEISKPISSDIYSRSIDDITLELEKIIN